MIPPDSRATQVLNQLALELAEAVTKRYRIDVAAARDLVMEAWATDQALWQQAVGEDDPARLARTRVYKQAADRAKTKIYYHLRRYRQDEPQLADGASSLRTLAEAGAGTDDPRALAARDAIVASHVSTRERLDDLPAFWSASFGLVPEPTSILDLGCGVQPLLYPFAGAGRSTTRYLALDRDAVAIELVAAWAQLVGDSRLEARRWSLAEGFAEVVGPEPDGRFALALALKLIPVLWRQEREQLSILAQVPARRLLVTGAREAMVKRRSIAQRERRVLEKFAEQQGFVVIDTLETASEIGLLLERG